jgi:acetyl-CoA carboxylase biotin carboxylase subunit
VFKRILIANRGEPAVRVIRTCRELGIETIVVYSEIDAKTMPVKLATRAVCIGPTALLDSYLNVPRVLSAAEITGAEAIHPGYGFLAENAEFAEMVTACNLGFIGPKPDTIRQVNDRVLTRQKALSLGIPILPGSPADVTSAAEARQFAEAIGYPVALKSARHSRKLWVVRKEKDLDMTLRMALADTRATLNDGRVYLEFLPDPARHIDVPVLGNGTDTFLALTERDASVQHRQERLIDEAPAPGLTAELRAQLREWTERLAREFEFRSVGAASFLLDASGKPFFLALRPSLQGAHPVTEVVLGCDLVAEQLRVASGEPVSSELRELKTLPPSAPYAIQCRILAEDAERDFGPTAGVVSNLRFPAGPGVRVDSHVYDGYEGSAQYDTLVAKVICSDVTREQAIVRAERALHETVIQGVKTTLEFEQKILRLKAFRDGQLSTTMVSREMFGVNP